MTLSPSLVTLALRLLGDRPSLDEVRAMKVSLRERSYYHTPA